MYPICIPILYVLRRKRFIGTTDNAIFYVSGLRNFLLAKVSREEEEEERDDVQNIFFVEFSFMREGDLDVIKRKEK